MGLYWGQIRFCLLGQGAFLQAKMLASVSFLLIKQTLSSNFKHNLNFLYWLFCSLNSFFIVLYFCASQNCVLFVDRDCNNNNWLEK